MTTHAPRQFTIAQISRKTKTELMHLAMADARERGRTWIIGGPTKMSKDELVSYLVRETELVKP